MYVGQVNSMAFVHRSRNMYCIIERLDNRDLVGLINTLGLGVLESGCNIGNKDKISFCV